MLVKSGGVYREVGEKDLMFWNKLGWEVVEETKEEPKKKKNK